MSEQSDALESFLAATAPEETTLQAEMAETAQNLSFPIVGAAAGGVLAQMARLADADRVFEFGSGFGYSATWFLRGGANHVVCTEFDEDEIEMGHEFIDDTDLADQITFEFGDAMETIDEYDGPFDVVLIDHQKHRYADAYEAVKPRLSETAVVVADNIISGPIAFDRISAYFTEDAPLPSPESDKETRGIATYLDRVKADEDTETVVLPVGSGLAVSVVTGK